MSELEQTTYNIALIKSELSQEIDQHTKLINLDREYQRSNVWFNEKKAEYIKSLIDSNSLSPPIPISFNRDNGDVKHCIDGKQRLSSIKEFTENRLCFRQQDELVFYDKIPSSYIPFIPSNDCIGLKLRKLTVTEKRRFHIKKIFVVVYDNLTYQQELSLFKGINNGVQVTRNEKLMSAIDNYESAKEFTRLRVKYHQSFKKFNLDKKGDDTLFLMLLIYFGENSKDTTKLSTIEDYFGKISKNQLRFKTIMRKYEKMLDLYLTPSRLLHDDLCINYSYTNKFLVMLLLYLRNTHLKVKLESGPKYDQIFRNFVEISNLKISNVFNIEDDEKKEERITNALSKSNLDKIKKIIEKEYNKAEILARGLTN